VLSTSAHLRGGWQSRGGGEDACGLGGVGGEGWIGDVGGVGVGAVGGVGLECKWWVM